MDLNDPLLSHQATIVENLSPYFNHIYVITGRRGEYKQIENVTVYDSNWRQGKIARNFFLILKTTFNILRTNKIDVVFSHMTDVQCSVVSPLTKLLGIPHFLWYAHTHRSNYLVWSSYWLDGIVTSTQGSCPIRGVKVKVIGQGIDSEMFVFSPPETLDKLRFLHIGRFDQSKRIHEILEAMTRVREKFPFAKFTQIGSPANSSADIYSKNVLEKYRNQFESLSFNFAPSVSRDKIPELFLNYDIFIHAYQGSLDKTIIEATLSGLPVVTTNMEYAQIFGTWGNADAFSLTEQIDVILSMKPDDLQAELFRRRLIAENDHSLKFWGRKLNSVLQS